MNFDTARKNYTGLALVAVLHLLAAGIALQHSTILVNRSAPDNPVVVEPLPPETKEPEHFDDFKPPFKAPPVITPRPPLIDLPDPVGPTITTSPPDTPPGTKPGPGKDDTLVAKAEAARHEPKTIAAVIDAARCAKPAYPAGALRNGDEGTVTLAFLVGKDGHVADARIERTSGHRDLDRAALQGLSLCAFKPGTIDGVAQESWARMQYAWRLDE